MTNQQIILDKLIAFRHRDKFSTFAWNERGLNPSDNEICSKIESLFNDCTDDLIDATKSNSKPKQMETILKNGLGSFNSSDFDTEEREFICAYFFQLSEIVKIEFKDNLNSWSYGKVLNTLFKVTSFFKGKEKIVETLSQDCTCCDSKLETFILRKEEGIPDHNWTIIQCNNCNEYNLLSKGPNIKELRFGNYKSIEQLNKTEFTEEQAKIRLKQIKFFRKK
jgi:hypothetical protein